MKLKKLLFYIFTDNWVDIQKPLNKNLKKRVKFISEHIQPILEEIQVEWDTSAQPAYQKTFFFQFAIDSNIYAPTSN